MSVGKTEFPDVIGYVLDEALPLIKEQGCIIDKISITKPVKATEPLGIARVVRLTSLDNKKIRVVVAYQEYEKGGVHNGL